MRNDTLSLYLQMNEKKANARGKGCHATLRYDEQGGLMNVLMRDPTHCSGREGGLKDLFDCFPRYIETIQRHHRAVNVNGEGGCSVLVGVQDVKKHKINVDGIK